MARKPSRDPYVEVECRINERYHCRCYKESQLPKVMEYLRSENVDVVYLNGEQTMVHAWLTEHYDSVELANEQTRGC